MLTSTVMIKPASGYCDMRCDYCYYHDETANREQALFGFMSEETLKNVIRKTLLLAEQSITYAFQGGEPTLRGLDFFKKAVALERHYNRNNIAVYNALQTNGYGLNEGWCRFFKENNFLVGVSVDGTKRLHDAHRRAAKDGAPTYDVITANLKLMEKYGVDYNILTVVTEDKAASAGEIYSSFKSRGWNYQQYIECLDPLGKGGGLKSFSLRPLSYGIFLTELFGLWHKDYLKGKAPYIRLFDNYIGILAGCPAEACNQRGECGIQIAVEADGSAYPCDFFMLDGYRLGNFNKEGLAAMDKRREDIGFIERSRKVASKCKACPYYFICRCGCQRSRDYLPGEDAYISHFCEGFQYFFGHCLERMKQMADNLR